MKNNELIEQLKNGGIVAIRDYLLEKQSLGATIARTESGDPSFDIPENVKTAINKALSENKTHYTAGAGINELREAVYKKLIRENKINADGPKNIFITNGAMNALFTVFHAINDNNNVSVLVPSPTWTETVQNVIEVGGRPVYYRFNPFSDNPIDINELELLIDENPDIKSLVINTPHNPTGKVLNKNLLTQLVSFCDNNNIYLVSDEAYEHVIFDDIKHISPGALSEYPKIISVFSFSKSYAMSGLRLGYVCTKDKTILNNLSKIIRCTINGVNSATQWGGVSALNSTSGEYFINNIKEYTIRRDTIFAGASSSKFLEPVKPEGAFYLWCRIKDSWNPELSEDRGWAMTADLLKQGIGAAPGEVFGPLGKNHIRFSFSCRTKDVSFAADVLRNM